jgi:hypothetical protein
VKNGNGTFSAIVLLILCQVNMTISGGVITISSDQFGSRVPFFLSGPINANTFLLSDKKHLTRCGGSLVQVDPGFDILSFFCHNIAGIAFSLTFNRN